MTTMNVKNAAGDTEAIEKPLVPGRAAAASSRPVVLSSEDKIVLDAIATLLTTQAGYVDGLEGLLTTISGKDFATQTTLAAILAKIIAAPATEAKQDTGNTSLASIATLLSTQAGYLDGVEGLLTTISGKDFATQTTLAAILAKIIAAPATEAKQDTGNTSLASILTALSGFLTVGGRQIVKTATPTVTASSAYASGNMIGGLLTFSGICRANDITGLIQKAQIFCKTAQTFSSDLVLFHTNPTNTTFTDKTALSLNAADFDKLIGVAHITDWTSLGTPSFAQADNLAMPFAPASGAQDIYGALVSRGTPTFGSTSDIKVAVKNVSD